MTVSLVIQCDITSHAYPRSGLLVSTDVMDEQKWSSCSWLLLQERKLDTSLLRGRT